MGQKEQSFWFHPPFPCHRKVDRGRWTEQQSQHTATNPHSIQPTPPTMTTPTTLHIAAAALLAGYALLLALATHAAGPALGLLTMTSR